MDHQILSKNTVYQARAFSVENLLVKLPDAREREYNLVRHNDSVTIIPVVIVYLVFQKQFIAGIATGSGK